MKRLFLYQALYAFVLCFLVGLFSLEIRACFFGVLLSSISSGSFLFLTKCVFNKKKYKIILFFLLKYIFLLSFLYYSFFVLKIDIVSFIIGLSGFFTFLFSFYLGEKNDAL